jgi:hypothetical protein
MKLSYPTNALTFNKAQISFYTFKPSSFEGRIFEDVFKAFFCEIFPIVAAKI